MILCNVFMSVDIFFLYCIILVRFLGKLDGCFRKRLYAIFTKLTKIAIESQHDILKTHSYLP